MPLYCTVADLGRFGVNAQATEDLPVPENLTPAIEARSAFIDSYLNLKFTLPILVWGADLKECCAVLAAWDVISVRGFKPDENPEDHPLRIRYEDMIKWLESIRDGELIPVVTDSDTGDDGDSGGGMRAPQVGCNESRGYQSDDTTKTGAFQGRRR